MSPTHPELPSTNDPIEGTRLSGKPTPWDLSACLRFCLSLVQVPVAFCRPVVSFFWGGPVRQTVRGPNFRTGPGVFFFLPAGMQGNPLWGASLCEALAQSAPTAPGPALFRKAGDVVRLKTSLVTAATLPGASGPRPLAICTLLFWTWVS